MIFISKFTLTVSNNLPSIMNACEKAFDALGDPTRRSIFEKLRRRPMAVVDVAKGLSVSRPAVSQHLKVLREAKLISLHPHGTKNIYQINEEGVVAMRNYLDQFWDEALEAFKKIAEQTAQSQKIKSKK
jgi:DNA-binding transcriptional ArsR family regulator